MIHGNEPSRLRVEFRSRPPSSRPSSKTLALLNDAFEHPIGLLDAVDRDISPRLREVVFGKVSKSHGEHAAHALRRRCERASLA